MFMCMTVPGYFELLMEWISGNFHIMSRHHEEKSRPNKTLEGFSIFNRSKLCHCMFHVHAKPEEAHPGHANCPVAPVGCGKQRPGMNTQNIDPMMQGTHSPSGNGTDTENDVEMSCNH
jgi:hypothetical protein